MPTITYDDKLKEPQSLVAGYKFAIDTQIAGIPVPQTAWVFNNEPLTTTDVIGIASKDTSSNLTIQKTEFTHSGVYTLKAVNEVGEATADFTITVKG
jgi:hypothetical protein